jgi:hypothetical protein
MPFSNIRNVIDSYMIKSLTEQTARIVEKARQNASFSSRIPNAINQGVTEKTDRGFESTIEIDSSRDGPAPHAAAFEYGSGEHATKGRKEKYIIEPKNASLLAFDWQPERVPYGSPKFFGAILSSSDTTQGRYFFHYVEHPGVEAKPYLKPAIESERAGLRNALKSVIKRAYADSVVKVEVISAKK